MRYICRDSNGPKVIHHKIIALKIENDNSADIKLYNYAQRMSLRNKKQYKKKINEIYIRKLQARMEKRQDCLIDSYQLCELDDKTFEKIVDVIRKYHKSKKSDKRIFCDYYLNIGMSQSKIDEAIVNKLYEHKYSLMRSITKHYKNNNVKLSNGKTFEVIKEYFITANQTCGLLCDEVVSLLNGARRISSGTSAFDHILEDIICKHGVKTQCAILNQCR